MTIASWLVSWLCTSLCCSTHCRLHKLRVESQPLSYGVPGLGTPYMAPLRSLALEHAPQPSPEDIARAVDSALDSLRARLDPRELLCTASHCQDHMPRARRYSRSREVEHRPSKTLDIRPKTRKAKDTSRYPRLKMRKGQDGQRHQRQQVSKAIDTRPRFAS